MGQVRPIAAGFIGVILLAVGGIVAPAEASTASLSVRMSSGQLVIAVAGVQHKCAASETETPNPNDPSSITVSALCANGTSFTYSPPWGPWQCGCTHPSSLTVHIGYHYTYECGKPKVTTRPQWSCSTATRAR
jgi:hypothetical protein